MKGEIDNDFYCSADLPTFRERSPHVGMFIYCSLAESRTNKNFPLCCIGCSCRHCKWPTPSQFKEEYGKEWKGAVYMTFGNPDNDMYDWTALDFSEIENQQGGDEENIVCACTPWGKPPANWRPE